MVAFHDLGKLPGWRFDPSAGCSSADDSDVGIVNIISVPATLCGGFALYIAGHLLFKQRLYGALSVPRLITTGVLLLLLLLAAAVLPPLVGLARVCTSWNAAATTRTRSTRRQSPRHYWRSSLHDDKEEGHDVAQAIGMQPA